MTYLLDTDPITLLQRETGQAYATLRARLAPQPPTEPAFPIISLHEQTMGCHAYINQARTAEDIVRGYAILASLLSQLHRLVSDGEVTIPARRARHAINRGFVLLRSPAILHNPPQIHPSVPTPYAKIYRLDNSSQVAYELVASFRERRSFSHGPRCMALAACESGAVRKMVGFRGSV